GGISDHTADAGPAHNRSGGPRVFHGSGVEVDQQTDGALCAIDIGIFNGEVANCALVDGKDPGPTAFSWDISGNRMALTVKHPGKGRGTGTNLGARCAIEF